MRIAILGNSGSGKSTAARWLAQHSAAPLLDLDTIAWVPGQIAVPRDSHEAQAELSQFCSQPSWIIEGCYGDLVQHSLGFAPLLLFLNPGIEQCVANCLSRPWEPHKYASQAEQDQRLAFLLDWVRDYETRDGPMSYQSHRDCFEQYRGPKLEVQQRPAQAELLRLLQSVS